MRKACETNCAATLRSGRAVSAVLAGASCVRHTSAVGGSGSDYVDGPGSGAPRSAALAVPSDGARERDPPLAREVELRGLGLEAARLLGAAGEGLVRAGVTLRARDAGVLLVALASDAGAVAGSHRSISSASARSSFTTARAARWAFLLALWLTSLSAVAACLRRPTCRRRSNSSVSFLAMILLVRLREVADRNPIRRRDPAHWRSRSVS